MTEKHPFGNFVPTKTYYLFLGSFAAQASVGYDWFFANKRSQFWPILESVYKRVFPTKKEKQQLFVDLHMAITDIILETERKKKSSLDINLTNWVINNESIENIFKRYQIKKVYFSSRFAEKLYRKYFKHLILAHPNTELITLPSPSPRYAAMSKSQKVERYKYLLPKF